jgi:enamine deaminase RidA (YjgF/YER057c/UK114 family)
MMVTPQSFLLPNNPTPNGHQMTHTRLRKFNTSDTYPEQNLDNDLCQAVVTQGGKTVWLRGQCPQNLDDAVNITSNDPVEQTHKVMQNIRQLIQEAGGNMEANISKACIPSQQGWSCRPWRGPNGWSRLMVRR